MAIEKLLLAVPAQLLLSNGGAYGQVQLPSTEGIKVKQKVILFANNQPKTTFEVKRVIDGSNIILGPQSSSMLETSNLTMFLTAMNASLYAEEQNRQAIPPDKFWRAVFEEEPTVAIRTFLVDNLGRRYTQANPIPVQLSDGSINIGTVNAELEVQLSHKDDTPNMGDVADSVRIGDGVDELKINSDGSINVVAQTTAASEDVKTYFNEVNSVVNGSPTTIVSYTVASLNQCYLNKIDYSGENVAKYTVLVNNVVIDLQRTYFGGDLNGTFDFANGSRGIKLTLGDVVTLKVLHVRPSSGDFNGRIQVVEV